MYILAEVITPLLSITGMKYDFLYLTGVSDISYINP